MRPRIGITTSYDDGSQVLDRRYVTAVERAEGLPMPLPMLDTDTTYSDGIHRIDGLVVIGGPAVVDGLVGSLPEELDEPEPIRAASDRKWLEHALSAGMPILGICYGMQRLNAIAGGTIYGDVEHQKEDALTHSQKRGATSHPVDIHSERLRILLDEDKITVNSRHLQAVAELGDGFTVAATAPDGVVEAIEHETGMILGVQFHPERMGTDMQPLFQWLITKARPVSSSPSQ